MDMVFKNGLMAQFTKANGLTTKLKEKALFGMQRVIFTLDNLRLIKQMDLVFTRMSMDQDMKVNGLTMYKKDKEKKLGSMEQSMSGSTEME